MQPESAPHLPDCFLRLTTSTDVLPAADRKALNYWHCFGFRNLFPERPSNQVWTKRRIPVVDKSVKARNWLIAAERLVSSSDTANHIWPVLPALVSSQIAIRGLRGLSPSHAKCLVTLDGLN